MIAKKGFSNIVNRVLVIGVLVIAEKGLSNIVNRVFVIIIINRGFGDC